MKCLSILLSVAMITFSTGCNADMFDCEHEISASVLSSDSELTAALDNVGCGATSSFVTWILVAKSGEELDPKKHELAVFNGRLIDIRWTGIREITVSGEATLVSSKLDQYSIKLVIE